MGKEGTLQAKWRLFRDTADVYWLTLSFEWAPVQIGCAPFSLLPVIAGEESVERSKQRLFPLRLFSTQRTPTTYSGVLLREYEPASLLRLCARSLGKFAIGGNWQSQQARK